MYNSCRRAKSRAHARHTAVTALCYLRTPSFPVAERVLLERMMKYIRPLAVLALCAVFAPPASVTAQGVTTGAITGIVTNEQQQPVEGASVIAIHIPSGSVYEATTRGDG